MTKKPSHRKRQQGKRRARAHRTRRRQPGLPEVTLSAAVNGRRTGVAEQRQQSLAELEQMLLAAIRSGEFVFDDTDESEVLENYDDDGEFDEPPVDFEPEAHRILVGAVAEIVSTRTAGPASDVAARLRAREDFATFNLCPGDSVLIGEAVALGILLELRYGPKRPDAHAAVRWVAEHLGPEHGARALGVADLLGHPDAPHWSAVQPPPDDGEPLLPGLVLLLAGAASTAPGALDDR